MNVTIKMLDELITVQRKFAMSTDKNYKLFFSSIGEVWFFRAAAILIDRGRYDCRRNFKYVQKYIGWS